MSKNEELLHQMELMKRENEQLRHASTIQATRVQDAEEFAKKAQQRAAEDARRADDANKRADAAEQQLWPTDCLSYLSLCHHKLFLSLEVQTKSELTSAGGAANVTNKRYPLHLKTWDDFPTLHGQCQRRLEAAFGANKIFQPAHGVDMVRDLFADGSVADEEDMKQFQCFAVEAAVRFILKYLFQSQPSSDQALSDSPA